MLTAQTLREAAQRFNARHDQFAAGKYELCVDLASKLERYGSFVSQRQAEFAAKLVEWSQPRAAATPAPSQLRTERLHEVMQRHARFYAGDVTLSRKNQDQLVWIKHAAAEKVIGKIDGGAVTLWNRPGVDMAEVRDLLVEFEGAPLQAAMKYGKLSGRCCSCGRDLTDPDSIEAGIGPVCATKFA